jgi:hypothetical protein
MGQQEIIDFLKKHKAKWYSTVDLQKELGTSKGALACNLKCLRKGGFVLYKEQSYPHIFYYKHRTAKQLKWK